MPHQPEPQSAPSVPTRSTEGDYRRLFDLSLDLLCVAGLDGYFKKVNPAWTRVLGWSEPELLARPVADFMHPDDRERTLQARADLAQGVLVRGLENRYVCRDGSYRWLSWQSSVEMSDRTVFAVARDITDRRHWDNEQLILGKLESTGILAGGMAHDFNNLLGGLLLSLDMVALSGPMNEHQVESLRQARESVRGAESLTQQLLTFAQGGTTARRPRDLRPLLQQSLNWALAGSDVQAVFEFEPELWTSEVDETQIGQVIRNLALNAREAMPQGGTIRLQANNVGVNPGGKSVAISGDCIRIMLTDEGSGIAPEVLPKVFDPYFSTKPRGTQKGMGLGLTICRAVVQRHGGTISIESQLGRGTTVTIHLPASRATLAADPVVGPPPAAASSSGPKRILVMDDEPMFREVVAQALHQYGYGVAVAANGNEAITVYERAKESGSPFDAVVFDLTVRGGMGGTEAMKALRARHGTVRGVLMTGYTSEETLRDFARHGFSAALSKPFSAETLRDTLVQLLGAAPRPTIEPGHRSSSR